MKSVFKPVIAAILQWEASRVLRKYKPNVIAVTGSVGKTSAKDAIYTVLASTFYVRKSEKSFNSEIGIPLTVLGRPNAWGSPIGWLRNMFEGLVLILLRNHYPKWLVLEVGADRPGDIQRVASWLTPDVAVVTRLPDVPVHVEFFDSPEAVIEEKSYVPRALRARGVLVLNADDEAALRMQNSATDPRVIAYGFSRGANLRASGEHIIYEAGKPVGMSFRVDSGGSSVPITLRGALGKQHIYAVLAGLAVGISQDLNLVSMGESFREHVAPPGRMRILEGVNDTVLIDDSYNSSPVAAEEALAVLRDIETAGKKIAVLGDMMELGTYSVDAHRALGAQVAKCADILITVGLRSRSIAESAHKTGMKKRQIHSFDESFQAGEKLATLIEVGDVVLLKGSQSIRLERAIEQILADPSQKQKLLVRQDTAWQRR